MTNERITKINKLGKAGGIISRIFLVFTIIAVVATAGVGIAAFSVPNDIAKVNVNGTAQIEIGQKYLDLGKKIISEVNTGMTEEGQTLEIAGSEYEYVSADINGDKININYTSLNNEIGVRNFAEFMAGVCLECINTLVLLCFVVALCKAIEKSQSPFDENIINKMKKLAIAFIPWVLIKGLATSLQGYSFTGKFDFDSGIDLGTVLIVLVFVVLISVFRYGAQLQQQSDETL